MKPTTFLQDATREQLLDATALNLRCWFHQIEERDGEDSFGTDDHNWSTQPFKRDETAVFIPRYNLSSISTDLDRFMERCRREEIKVVSFWALDIEEVPVLAAPLLARGFGFGGQPRWMALDLSRMKREFAAPEELRIEIIKDEAEWLRVAPEDLPCRKSHYVESLPNRETRRSWHFGAWLGDRPVGHVQVLLTRGSLGVAGLYDVGVIPEVRNRGIGKALLAAACCHAKELGCRYATLHTENEEIYQSLGFETIGQGRNWWIQEPEIDLTPDPAAVAFVEVLGRGETEHLDRLRTASLLNDLDQPLMCYLTPLEVCAATHQSGSAEWLLQHGATPDLVSLWGLGWEERIPGYLSRNPELINRRFGQEKKTPLHEAVWRNDAGLVRFLLRHGADPTLEDENFQSDPLGWAQYLGRPELVPLLEGPSSQMSSSMPG